MAIVLMVREAAEECAEGVRDGEVVETREYQDAWGFMQVARAISDELARSPRPEVQEALATYREQFDMIAPAFPAIVPDAATVPADPALLYGAAR